MTEFVQPAKLHLGAAYYPEHWPEERWSEDIRLMQEAGLTVVRMGEFAWSSLEPAQGKFRFAWLERAIQLLADAGIDTILGTPTAAPPAWLVQQQPGILAVGEDGRRVQFGNRCHACPTAPELHAAIRRLVGKLAVTFGGHPNVIGWQIDNEFNRVCACERCQAVFRQYLQEKFGTLDELNRRWTTAYWSQTYSDWEQIPIPIGSHNPGLMLEFKRFTTRNYWRFQRLQIDLLRPHLRPEVWITHNFMGWFAGYDHYELAEDLDLASWDWYVGTGHPDYLSTGATHDLVRGFKRKNFWVMETQPGNVNWSSVNNSLAKGEGRAMAWQAVIHGADGLLYWQWRSALGGQEQYHGTLVDQSGQPRPFFAEVQQLGKEFQKVGELLAGAQVKAKIALLNSYDSRWSIDWQRHHRDFDYVRHLEHYYRPIAARNIPVDVISADAPLDGYRMVIAPALLLLNEARVESLKVFCKQGGHLLLTARCGMKDSFNALLPERQPGPLAQLAGVEVEEYYALDEPVPVKGNWFAGQSELWAERLKPVDEKFTFTVARYGPSNGWLDEQVAITVHAYGSSGMVYYIGAYLDKAAQDALIDHILRNAQIKPIKTPPGVEVRSRVNAAGREVYCVVNHLGSAQTLWLPWEAQDHLSDQAIKDRLELPPYAAAVLTRTNL